MWEIELIDSGATKHIFINKNDFVSCTEVEKGEEIVYLMTYGQLKFLEKEKFFSNSHLVEF